ncbi:MAG: M6 family metalloprotease domain-containing protein [Muribaculaceae bacterium]|nr:M6 family metalloprotease domain-containing protein [Muribaculaceae bacterium]
MKKTILGIAALGMAATAWAAPARPGLFTYTQPDGTRITISMTGDEYGHRIFAADGTELADDGTGRLVPLAQVDLKREGTPRLKRKAAPSVMTVSADGTSFNPGICPASFPAKGEGRALVVLVEYKDVKFDCEDPHDYFSRMLNEEGFKDYGATGSVRDFFIENSMGQFKPQFDVFGPLTLEYNRIHYGKNTAWGDDAAPEEMAIEACRQLDDIIDFNDYDQDGDGFIDNIFVFYAAKGENSGGSAGTVWPHSADISDLRDDIFEFDGVRLNHYACSNETMETYSGERPDGIGTFIHEFSHVLGLPDLYSTVYNNAFTPGEWSTLDTGPYNNEGRTPPYYSAYERFALGWLQPEHLSAGTHTLEAVNESNHAYFVPTDSPDEYFLLECRVRKGYDRYIPGEGMLVWHVDYDETAWYENTVNNERNHQRVDLVEADNRQTGATRPGDAFPGTSGIRSFAQTTLPAFESWQGKWVGFELSDISFNGRTVTFTVTGEGSGINGVTGESDWQVSDGMLTAVAPVSVYNLGGMAVAHLNPGETRDLTGLGAVIIVSPAGASKYLAR